MRDPDSAVNATSGIAPAGSVASAQVQWTPNPQAQPEPTEMVVRRMKPRVSPVLVAVAIVALALLWFALRHV